MLNRVKLDVLFGAHVKDLEMLVWPNYLKFSIKEIDIYLFWDLELFDD